MRAQADARVVYTQTADACRLHRAFVEQVIPEQDNAAALAAVTQQLAELMQERLPRTEARVLACAAQLRREADAPTDDRDASWRDYLAGHQALAAAWQERGAHEQRRVDLLRAGQLGELVDMLDGGAPPPAKETILADWQAFDQEVNEELAPARNATLANARRLVESVQHELEICARVQPKAASLCQNMGKSIRDASQRLAADDPQREALRCQQQAVVASQKLAALQRIDQSHAKLASASGQVQALREQLKGIKRAIRQLRLDIDNAEEDEDVSLVARLRPKLQQLMSDELAAQEELRTLEALGEARP